MTAFTVHWDYVVAVRPALKHNHTQTRRPYHDISENTPLILCLRAATPQI